MIKFKFSGSIQSSKSMLNRAWLAKSYSSQLKIHGDSQCDDVQFMKRGLLQLATQKEIDCGEAGTVFRFLALRASREPGSWKLVGSQRLLSRPQQDLIYIMEQLGVRGILGPNSLTIESAGWKRPLFPVRIHREQSSQFASSLLLNSWNLDFPLEFDFRGAAISEGYWQMSLDFAQALGMQIDIQREQFKIPARQNISAPETTAEIDYSSTFAICAAAALAGEVNIINCEPQTRQPDALFLKALKTMGVQYSHVGSVLKLSEAPKMNAIDLNLSSAPDMFPVLAVLCAFAEGTSRLTGAPQLAHKESNRLEKTFELLQKLGGNPQMLPDGMVIPGLSANFRTTVFDFDSDHDHRMAMAAGIAKLKGFQIRIAKANSVNKSFPEFWKIIGIQP